MSRSWLRLPKNFGVKAAIISVVAFSAALIYKYGVSCIYLKLFGIPCPGCGITRATAALLSGRFADVLYYYPAYGALPLLFLYFLYDGEVFSKKWLNRTVLIVCATAVAAAYIYKLNNFI